jgi:hypothetical protein
MPRAQPVFLSAPSGKRKSFTLLYTRALDELKYKKSEEKTFTEILYLVPPALLLR